MKKIGVVVLMITASVLASSLSVAESVSNNAPPISQPEDEYNKAIDVKSRYGAVQYRLHSGTLTVDGNIVYGGDGGYDVLNNLGVFQLNNEDVILFGAGNTASVGVPDDLFFLVLKPNAPPRIVGTPLNPQINEVKKAWREGDVVFVEFVVGDYDKFNSPLKFENDTIVITKATPALYLKSGPRLKDEDCSNLYDIASESCATTFTEHKLECSKNAKAGQVFRGRGDLLFFNYISDLPGYSEKDFNKICVAWCRGKSTAYEHFSKVVCNIK